MKKIISLCIMSSFLVAGLCIADEYTDFSPQDDRAAGGVLSPTRSVQRLAVKPAKIESFYRKLEKCTPAKIQSDGEKVAIYGKTKNGKCHYSYTVSHEDEIVPVQCMFPMSVAVALSSINLDMLDTEYAERAPGISEERAKQLQEIANIAKDYCDYSFMKK